MLSVIFACVLCFVFGSTVLVQPDAPTRFRVQFSEQGYWYAKALNYDQDLPEDVCFLACNDSQLLQSKTCLDFFQNKLPAGSSELNKLKFWPRVHDRKIPESEKAMLKKNAKVLNFSLPKYVDLFESIKKFWGITENTPVYVFNSKMNDKQNNGGAFFVSNFLDKSGINSVLLTCLPPFGEKISREDYMGIIAHEFSHSMYSAANKKYVSAKLKTIKDRIAELPSKNSIVASWYIDETMAVVLGNGIFCEKASGKRPKFKGSESCEPAGLASAIYDLTLKYFASAKSIDDNFLNEVMRIFDQLYPNACIDPRVCLGNFSVVCPPHLQEDEIFAEIFQSLHPFEGNLANFDELTAEKTKEISENNSTLMIIFENKEQLDRVRVLIPDFDETKPINIVHKDKRTYIFLKIDKDHSFKERFEELIKI